MYIYIYIYNSTIIYLCNHMDCWEILTVNVYLE